MDQCQPPFAAKFSVDSGTTLHHQICEDRLTRSDGRFPQMKQGEKPMKRLVSRAIHHPSIAISMFYLTDLMCNVDCSPSGALLVLAAKSMSRLLRLLNKA